MPVINLSVIDTNPGMQPDNPFCPPADWKSDGPDAYFEMMRERFLDRMHGQRMVVQARHANNPEALDPVVICGPYAHCVQTILDKIA